MLSSFVRLNRRICSRIEKRLPQRRVDISLLYERTVGNYMRTLPSGSLVVDAGGGTKCSYAEYKPAGITIVAVDSSEEELRQNTEADRWLKADLNTTLPFADRSVEIVTSKHVLEHLPDISRFIDESRRILKPGGSFIHLLPSRYASFAVLSRLLPDRLKQRLVARLHPETQNTRRFHTWYDRCYPSALESLLHRHGFEVEQTTVSYYGAHYFGFFLPLYLLAVAWELLVLALGARDLCAALFIVGRKQS